MKNILLIFVFIISSFAIEQKFLEPEDALQQSFKKKENKLIIQLKLGEKIYTYHDKLKVLIKKPNTTNSINIISKLNLPKAIFYQEMNVHFKKLEIEVPYSLLKNTLQSDIYDVEFHYQGCSTKGLCYPPMINKISLDLSKINTLDKLEKLNIIANKNTQTKDTSDFNESDLITNSLKEGNLLLILASFFGFGLLLSLTPCVFPMIPILSSIIISASQKKQITASRGFFLSLVYVLSMSLAYTIAGVLAGLFGANLQVALQNSYVLFSFAFIFVVLAFSLFGYFKIEIPSSWQNKINKSNDKKNKQGVVGIAIMGFLSALIVGPCVAPPLAGALIYIGQTGDALLGGLALFTLSLGMGVPLLLIGIGAGKYMPSAGEWMNNISKIFGIFMLAIAIWMIERVIDPNLSMYLWSFLLIASALHLNSFKHIIIKLLSILILIYGIISFIGAISLASNIFNPLEHFIKSEQGTSFKSNTLIWTKIKNIKELDLAIQNSSKPIMLDFYASWCVSCKELDLITFKDKEVINKLSQFTLLKVDVSENNAQDKALQKKFNIVGPPALIFWDTNNKEINQARIIGYKNPKDFLAIVNKYFK